MAAIPGLSSAAAFKDKFGLEFSRPNGMGFKE
jgi:hypothetical protein